MFSFLFFLLHDLDLELSLHVFSSWFKKSYKLKVVFVPITIVVPISYDTYLPKDLHFTKQVFIFIFSQPTY